MSTRKISEAQVAHPRAHEPIHFVADLVKHATNLPVDALPQNHSQLGRRDRMDALELCALAVEHHSAQQFRGEFRLPGMIERDLVLLVDFVARMHQALREIAVVRQDQQAFTLRVEPADVEKPRHLRRQQIEDGVARVGIAPSRDVTHRLMQQNVEPLLRSDHFAPDFDVIAFRRLDAEVGADAAVDGDTPCRDQFIAVAARPDTGRREKTIEAHREWGSATADE